MITPNIEVPPSKILEKRGRGRPPKIKFWQHNFYVPPSQETTKPAQQPALSLQSQLQNDLPTLSQRPKRNLCAPKLYDAASGTWK